MAKAKATEWEVSILQPLDRLPVDDDGFIHIAIDATQPFEFEITPGSFTQDDSGSLVPDTDYVDQLLLWSRIPTDSDTAPCRLLPEDDVTALLALWPNMKFNGQELHWRCPLGRFYSDLAFKHTSPEAERFRDYDEFCDYSDYLVLQIVLHEYDDFIEDDDDADASFDRWHEQLFIKLAGLTRKERSSPSFYPDERELFKDEVEIAIALLASDTMMPQYWAFHGKLIEVKNADRLSQDEISALVGHAVLEEDRAFQDMKDEIAQFNRAEARDSKTTRPSIPKDVQMYVWKRDDGKCVECGSNEHLEYDHIIPVSKGGSSTERNLQLLCETCNRQKGASI